MLVWCMGLAAYSVRVASQASVGAERSSLGGKRSSSLTRGVGGGGAQSARRRACGRHARRARCASWRPTCCARCRSRTSRPSSRSCTRTRRTSCSCSSSTPSPGGAIAGRGCALGACQTALRRTSSPCNPALQCNTRAAAQQCPDQFTILLRVTSACWHVGFRFRFGSQG